MNTHAYLDYRNSARTLVARLFWPGCLLWNSAQRQCGPHIARDRRHSHYFEIVRNCIVKSLKGYLPGSPSIVNIRKEIPMLYTVIVVLIVLFLIGYLR